MAEIVNDCDVLLQAASVRKLTTAGVAVVPTPSSSNFYARADGSHGPDYVRISVATILCDGPFTFAVQGAKLSNVTATTADITYADMTSPLAIVTVTAANAGAPVQGSCIIGLVSDGQPAQNGVRGAGQYYIPGSVWSDAAAKSACPGGNPVAGDVVTISNGSTYALTKKYDGTAWNALGAVYDGSLFVTGTINGAAIKAGTLELFEPNGTPIIRVGSALNPAYVPDSAKNNIIDLSLWTRGYNPGNGAWGGNGEYNSIATCSPSGGADLTIPGPKGGSDLIWYCKEVNNDGGPGGGWDAPYFTLDKTKTYRFVITIRRLTGQASSYWGTHGVADLNTTTLNTNPYFANAPLHGLSGPDRWYLFVGYIYPAGSVTNTHDSAGIWDCKTGQKVASGMNFCFMPDGQPVHHRAYQYYATANAEQVFGRPMINLVDGTEPSLREYFEAGAVMNTAISVNPDGSLNNAGGGKVTLPGIGQDTYRIFTKSNTASNAPSTPVGLYKNGGIVHGVQRSYSLVVIQRSSGSITWQKDYDVYGAGEIGGAKAFDLALDLNNLAEAAGQYIVIVYTFDEPRNRREESGLMQAMYRNGASRGVFGSSQFQSWSAYALVGISGCGEGNGAEAYQGAVSGDPNAWIDVSFGVVAGNLTGVTLNYVPKTLQDYGYLGDMNATNGAPSGTSVGGTEAGLLASRALNGDMAYNALPGINSAIASKLSAGSRNVLAGGAGIAVGSITWDGAGNYTGGYGVAINNRGIVAYNTSGENTLFLSGSDGTAAFKGAVYAQSGYIGGMNLYNGALCSGPYASYAWPAANAGNGTYFGAAGILLGNKAAGAWFQVDASGYMSLPGFELANSQLTLTQPILVNPKTQTSLSLTLPNTNLRNQSGSSVTVNVSPSIANGSGSYAYQWSVTEDNNRITISGSATGSTVTLKASGSNIAFQGQVSLTIRDLNTQAIASNSASVYIQFGNGQLS